MQGVWVWALVRKLREENESEEGRDGDSIISNVFLLIELENAFPPKYVTSFCLNQTVVICQVLKHLLLTEGFHPHSPSLDGRGESSLALSLVSM